MRAEKTNYDPSTTFIVHTRSTKHLIMHRLHLEICDFDKLICSDKIKKYYITRARDSNSSYPTNYQCTIHYV